MKLIGSKMEEDFREQLVRSRDSLFRDEDKRRLLAALRQQFPSIESAFVLNWTPEQGEDLFRVLVNGDSVAAVEIDRVDPFAVPDVEVISVNEYSRGLSKTARIRLAVALDLARRESDDS